MKKGGVEKGTLPGYKPERLARKLADRPFGMRRFLSVSEEGDMLLTGLNRRTIANMTPKELKELADLTADQSNLLLGS